jgi:hypothetical protein
VALTLRQTHLEWGPFSLLPGCPHDRLGAPEMACDVHASVLAALSVIAVRERIVMHVRAGAGNAVQARGDLVRGDRASTSSAL